MVYVVGIIGFLCGFLAGQMVLMFLLRHKTKDELLSDKTLKFKYGMLNWGFAALGCYSFIQIYNQYFIP